MKYEIMGGLYLTREEIEEYRQLNRYELYVSKWAFKPEGYIQ